MTTLQITRDRLIRRQTARYYHFEDPLETSLYKKFPLKQAMIADDAKLVYLPIAKNACSSLKNMMAELGGIGAQDEGEDIHLRLDSEPTNLLFMHRAAADIRNALADNAWMRFVVLRHPIERLLSVYIETSVLHRQAPSVSITIDPVMLRSLGIWVLKREHYARGISFRYFANDILAEDPKRLGPHWRPQSLMLDQINFTHVYTMEHLRILKAEIEAHLGRAVDLPRLGPSKFPPTGTLAPDVTSA